MTRQPLGDFVASATPLGLANVHAASSPKNRSHSLPDLCSNDEERRRSYCRPLATLTRSAILFIDRPSPALLSLFNGLERGILRLRDMGAQIRLAACPLSGAKQTSVFGWPIPIADIRGAWVSDQTAQFNAREKGMSTARAIAN
jgi:hypothetical protein